MTELLIQLFPAALVKSTCSTWYSGVSVPSYQIFTSTRGGLYPVGNLKMSACMRDFDIKLEKHRVGVMLRMPRTRQQDSGRDEHVCFCQGEGIGSCGC